jgi:hypothetical protein
MDKDVRKKGPWLCLIEEDFFGLSLSVTYNPEGHSFQIAALIANILLVIGCDF